MRRLAYLLLTVLMLAPADAQGCLFGRKAAAAAQAPAAFSGAYVPATMLYPAAYPPVAYQPVTYPAPAYQAPSYPAIAPYTSRPPQTILSTPAPTWSSAQAPSWTAPP
jgi:hypothetical protein